MDVAKRDNTVMKKKQGNEEINNTAMKPRYNEVRWKRQGKKNSCTCHVV